ncbi:MAG: tryptophan--tRNA ligase [Myxococcota bacterium]
MTERPTSLTGIKPTNEPHLGNYLGAIRPALELSATYDTFYFIADYHALTIVRDREAMRKSVYDVAATWLACGLDPAATTFFRQSDVPEVFELAWVLSCMVATGQLERGHSYKEALAKGDAPNAGIFNYPVLMAADIVLYDTKVVPVGKDQKQHLELTRDMATRFNHVFGAGEEVLTVPEPLIGEAQLVPGLDGHKMSKSRGNGIALFWPQKKLRKTIMKIVTGSEPLEAPKEPEGTLVELTRLLTPHVADEMAGKLRAGGYGWGHAKQDFFEALDAELAPMREKYEALRGDEAAIDAMLVEGAERARVRAARTMTRVRQAIGMR